MIFFDFILTKIFGIAMVASCIGFIGAPFLIRFLHHHKLWKKSARLKAISGEDAVVFNALHKDREVSVPRMGGLLITGTTLGSIALFYILSILFPHTILRYYNFLSQETIIPLTIFIFASLFGLLDDFLVVSNLGRYIGGGISFTKRLIVVGLLGLIAALWMYVSLHLNSITLPIFGEYVLGIWYIPLVIIVMIATWSGGIIDGIDGLSGGAFITIFGAFTLISLSQGKIDLATFCAVIVGGLIAFLWFNIPPAKFYMTEVGVLGLTTTTVIIAFLTDAVAVLPIIAGLLVMEVGSVIIQLISKKFRGKKIFLSTPIHHHFEAIGWPAYKVTMRFWIIGGILAILGIAIKLLT